MNSKCKDDSCDASHCPMCGGHKLSFYSLGVCDSCQLEIDYKLDKKIIICTYCGEEGHREINCLTKLQFEEEA